MRAGVMNAGIFGVANRAKAAVEAQDLREQVRTHATEWSEEAFACQQIRNLTRQVFSAGGESVRHVVFSGVEMGETVNDVCLRVGNALAFERQEDVLVALSNEAENFETGADWTNPIRSCATRVDRNLWQLTIPGSCRLDSGRREHRSLMQAVRSEFQYSIIAGTIASPTGSSSLAEFADGVVLVISALRTRRAAARKLLGELSSLRVLGTVLQGREFPIPAGIYRRL